MYGNAWPSLKGGKASTSQNMIWIRENCWEKVDVQLKPKVSRGAETNTKKETQEERVPGIVKKQKQKQNPSKSEKPR